MREQPGTSERARRETGDTAVFRKIQFTLRTIAETLFPSLTEIK